MRNEHYINGQWVMGHGRELRSVNPCDGETVWQGHIATADEVDQAVHAARRCAADWANTAVQERIHCLQAFARHVSERKTELTHLIALETGKPLWEAATEVAAVTGKINLSIQAWQERCAEKQGSLPDADTWLRYKPQGVVVVLGAFNFPAHLSNGHIVPALLAGNCVLYKPSELTPAVAGLIMQCWHDSGLPAGVLNCLQGDASTGAALLAADIQGVYFTGSYATGKRIHQLFADRPEVILALEMGGNNPLIIDNDVDREAAVYQTVLSTLITAGQRCTCARRVFIANTPEGDALVADLLQTIDQLVVGDFRQQPEPFMGPVIGHTQALNLLSAQKNLQAIGGKSLRPMTLLREGSGLLSPGVMDMSAVAEAPDEELFGPFIQLYRYDRFEQALMQANQTRYGLAAGLFSNSQERYEQFFRGIRAGLVNWNRPTTGAASALPFGGVGHSGNHRPSAYFAADYCAYPIASLEKSTLLRAETRLPGIR